MSIQHAAYAFGPFRIEPAERVLTRAGQIVPLTPKAFDTLFALVARAGHLVTKEELIELVWPDAFVEPNNLAQNVSALRRALGEQEGGPRFIETVPKRGYRFVSPVTVSAQAASLRAATMAAPLHHVQSVPDTRYARSGDVNIAYQVVGDGPLDLVFVMGWVSHLEYSWTEPSFARFLRRLASFSRLILFDKRGTGLSDRVTVLPSLEQRMDDVRAVMEAVGSHQAALLGVSEGGPMCSLFAATYPERTLALVTIGSYARRLRSPEYPWGPTLEERAAFHEEIQRQWGGPVGVEERAPSRAHDPAFREWWSTYLRMGASPGAALALTKMNADIDVREVLPTIRVPTLVLHRAGDRCLSVEEGHYLASRIPSARFVELDGEDHLPFVGDQDALLDEVEGFLTGFRHGPAIEREMVLATLVRMSSEAPVAHDATARLQAFCAREVERYRGRRLHHDAEGMLAMFDGPARAVRCASIIGEAARRLGVSLRVGVHTGECELEAVDHDAPVRGPAVGIADRVARTARPFEVVVSRTVRDLVAGAGLSFKPHTSSVDDGAGSSLTLFTVDIGHLATALMSY